MLLLPQWLQVCVERPGNAAQIRVGRYSVPGVLLAVLWDYLLARVLLVGLWEYVLAGEVLTLRESLSHHLWFFLRLVHHLDRVLLWLCKLRDVHVWVWCLELGLQRLVFP